MSWDVSLERAGPVERREDGGTYVLGGTTEADLNVTYNYGGEFRSAWPEKIEGSNALGKMLDGRKALDTIPLMEQAIVTLTTDRDGDYWAPTPGNAGYALSILLGWARQYPKGTWRVT